MSAQFTDKNGKAWEVHVTPTERDAIKAAVDVDIYDIVNGEKAGELMLRFDTDDAFLIDVIKCCVPDGGDDLHAALFGDVLNDAYEAFLRACVDFFRSPQQKQVVQNVLKLMQVAAAKNLQIAEAIGDKSTKLIAEAIEEIDAKQLVETSTNSAMNSQDLQGST